LRSEIFIDLDYVSLPCGAWRVVLQVSQMSVVIMERDIGQVLLVKRLMLVISYDAKLSMAVILGW
jgi:hypothetical protein